MSPPAPQRAELFRRSPLGSAAERGADGAARHPYHQAKQIPGESPDGTDGSPVLPQPFSKHALRISRWRRATAIGARGAELNLANSASTYLSATQAHIPSSRACRWTKFAFHRIWALRPGPSAPVSSSAKRVRAYHSSWV